MNQKCQRITNWTYSNPKRWSNNIKSLVTPSSTNGASTPSKTRNSVKRAISPTLTWMKTRRAILHTTEPRCGWLFTRIIVWNTWLIALTRMESTICSWSYSSLNRNAFVMRRLFYSKWSLVFTPLLTCILTQISTIAIKTSFMLTTLDIMNILGTILNESRTCIWFIPWFKEPFSRWESTWWAKIIQLVFVLI